MRRVLVAVDGSEASRRAAQLAAEVARVRGEGLLLVHASMPALLPQPVYADLVRTLEADEQAESAKLLAEHARAISNGVPVETRWERGPAVDVILAVAESPEVSWVVIGSRGRKAAARVLLGSVADRVLHLCSKPVLVVH